MKKSMLLLLAIVLTVPALTLYRPTLTNAQQEVDITVLIETADTPEDHLKIAEYYEEQAVMMEKKATLHEAMAKAYQGGKMAGMPSHCDKLAADSKASAEQYRDMAAEHRKMAQQTQDTNTQSPQ